MGDGNHQRDALTVPPPLLAVDGLVAGYGKPVVGPVSFSLGRGEIVGLSGANGTGKTTLLNAVIGMARIFAGLVERDHAVGVSLLRQFPVRLPEMPLLGSEFLRIAGAEDGGLFGRTGGDDTYAVMLLSGWSIALLLAANTAHGEDLSRALLQGQIYFTGASELTGIVATAALSRAAPWESPRLLLGRFFPEHFAANGIANPRHEVAFDMLAAVTLAVAASVVGVMGAFALVFVPPWIAFRFAHGWRRTVGWSVGLGVLAYVVAFVLAIALDQPFGPMLVATLLAVAAARALARTRRR